MPRHLIVPATIAHVHKLARAMRAEDAAEATALGVHPRVFLRTSFRLSLYARTVLVDGEIAAMWGLAGDILSDHGTPWLITAAAIERLPVTFVREARREVADMVCLKGTLENYVAATYTRAVRLLQVLGFTLDPPQPLGKHAALFQRFHMERP